MNAPDATTDRYLLDVLAGVMSGTLQVHELPPALTALMAWATRSLHERISDLEHDNDRLYFEMSRRPAAPEPTAAPDYRTYADLSDIRGDHDRADRHRARMQGVAA